MAGSPQLYSLLADGVLMIHAAFVAFVILGLACVWIGGWRKWRFVQSVWFRIVHLAAIGGVAAESLTGFVCPLTTWEEQLRVLAGDGERYAGSFIQHWLHRVLFYEFDERVFTGVYVALFLLVALSFWWVPVRWPRGG